MLVEPRQANLCLRAFRHDTFQLCMPSHSEGPGIWLSVWRFLLIHCLYERAAKVLARLRGCAGSPEPSLLAYAISTKFAWRGPVNVIRVKLHTLILENRHQIHEFKCFWNIVIEETSGCVNVFIFYIFACVTFQVGSSLYPGCYF